MEASDSPQPTKEAGDTVPAAENGSGVVEAGPVYSVLRDASPSVVATVDRMFAIPIPGIRFSRRFGPMIRAGKFDGKAHLFRVATGRFPTGLLEKVLKVSGAKLVDNRFPVDRFEAIDRAQTVKLNGIELSEFQREAVVANVKHGRGLDLLATNAGKSEVSIATALALGGKALWLVGRKDLLHQCAERFELRTGQKAGKIGDGEFEVGELMTVASVNSLDPKSKEGKKFLSQFTTLLVDECLHAQSATWYEVCMACPAPYRFGLTGSPPEEKLKLYRIMATTGCQVLCEKKNSDLIKEGWSATPIVHLQHLKYPINNFEYRIAYDSMIRYHKGYAAQVAAEAEFWFMQEKTVLVIVDRMAQGAAIQRELSGRNVPSFFINGGHDGDYRKETLDKFKTGRIPVLVATSILDEGVDVPAIQTLILAAGGLSPTRQLQRVGRGLRKKAGENTVDIVDYIHDGNEHLLRHSIKRVDLYEREGFKLDWREPIDFQR